MSTQSAQKTADRYQRKRKIVNVIRYALIAVVMFVFLAPFYWIIKTSIEPTSIIYGDIVPYPGGFTLEHYQAAIDAGFLGAIRNSLFVAVGATLLATGSALIGAYAILRYEFRGRAGAAKMVLLTYMFPHVALIVPMYYLVSLFGLIDHPIALVFIHTMLALPFCIWILQAFLSEIPVELEEAAMVEGATRFEAFFRITVPQAFPGIIAAGTFAFIMSWGEYMFAFILLPGRDSNTVPVALNTLLGAYALDWGMLAAASVIATLPVLAIFWLMAKYLGRGIAKGTGMT
jgi:ABC-type glycerol-3-phosphate transport system permease component